MGEDWAIVTPMDSASTGMDFSAARTLHWALMCITKLAHYPSVYAHPKVLLCCPKQLAMLHQVSNEVTPDEVEPPDCCIDCWILIAHNLNLGLCLRPR